MDHEWVRFNKVKPPGLRLNQMLCSLFDFFFNSICVTLGNHSYCQIIKIVVT